MRNAYFDNVKFLLITFVVLGHMALAPIMYRSEVANTLYIFFYFFHMPVFIFIAGYFSKGIHKENYFTKVLKGVFIPYLIFQTIYTIFDNNFNDQKLEISYFSAYYALWFLLSLTAWKLLLPIFVKLKYSLILSVILAIVVGYLHDIGGYLSLSRTFVFFPSFLVGFYCEKKHLNVLFQKRMRVLAACVIVASLVLIYYYGQGINKALLMGSVDFEYLKYVGFQGMLNRIYVMLATVIIGMAILSLTPRRHIPLLTDMGSRTMYAYILHAFLVKYLAYTHFYNAIDTNLEKVLWVIACIMFTMLLLSNPVRRIFRFIVEPRINWLFKDNLLKK